MGSNSPGLYIVLEYAGFEKQLLSPWCLIAFNTFHWEVLLLREREMENLCGAVKKLKPYLAMVSLQFGYAGLHIVTMLSLKGGLNHYVLTVYRHVVALSVLAPFAFFLERSLSQTHSCRCLFIRACLCVMAFFDIFFFHERVIFTCRSRTSARSMSLI